MTQELVVVYATKKAYAMTAGKAYRVEKSVAKKLIEKGVATDQPPMVEEKKVTKGE